MTRLNQTGRILTFNFQPPQSQFVLRKKQEHNREQFVIITTSCYTYFEFHSYSESERVGFVKF